MGWTWIPGSTRKGVIAELTDPEEWAPREDGKIRYRRTLTKQYKGAPWKGTLYVVYQDGFKGEPEKPEDRWIGVHLLSYWKCKRDGGGWGYKDMCASMGPSEVRCPLKYLEMCPKIEGEWEADWRDAVKKYHARQRAGTAALQKLKVGETVYLQGCKVDSVTLTSKRPLMGRASTGYMYRIPRRLIDAEKTFAALDEALKGPKAVIGTDDKQKRAEILAQAAK